MGFFQDLKQDLSQTVNGLEPEDAVAELNLEEAEAAASQDLFGTSREDDLAKLDAMLEQEVAAYGDVSVEPVSLQENPVHRDNNDRMAEQLKTNVVEIPVAEENSKREADEEMEQLLNEVRHVGALYLLTRRPCPGHLGHFPRFLHQNKALPKQN